MQVSRRHLITGLTDPGGGIQNVGEAEFHRAPVRQAHRQLRNGLPLRADINVTGYLTREPEGAERA